MRTIERLYLLLLGAFLCLPILASLIYSLSGAWGASILPDSFSLEWYTRIMQDIRFGHALLRTTALCAASLLLGCLAGIPATFVCFYYYPRWSKALEALTLVPFIIPPVVSSVGLLHIYAASPLMGSGWLLLGLYACMVMPFIHRAVSNCLYQLQVRELMDAARLLGADSLTAFSRIILPNIRHCLPGALCLALAALLGEFVFASMLAARFETLQVYLFNSRHVSGHLSSALLITLVSLSFLFSYCAHRYSSRQDSSHPNSAIPKPVAHKS